MDIALKQQLEKNLLKDTLKEFIDCTRQTMETKIQDVLTILQSMKEDNENNISKCNKSKLLILY